ncbi:MAG TPA: hypothetical protein VD998_02745 [Verrucomicrobiae bacterium]|nr:hypothetical protein [Verrucomicrobiae bacterium]
MFKDYHFWFSQPSSILSDFDYAAGYLMAGFILAGVILWLFSFVIKHVVVKQALSRFRSWLLVAGISGLIWFAFRYENTPIFAKRAWLVGIAAIFLIWLGYILKYMFFKFAAEKSEYDNNLLKSKYMPKPRS